MSRILDVCRAAHEFHGAKCLAVENDYNNVVAELQDSLSRADLRERQNIIYLLTYHPELIGEFIDTIINDDMTFSNAKHPLLNEYAHQTSLFYRKDMIDNPEYDKIRDKIKGFLTELKQRAPHFFETRDGYRYLPWMRVWDTADDTLQDLLRAKC